MTDNAITHNSQPITQLMGNRPVGAISNPRKCQPNRITGSAAFVTIYLEDVLRVVHAVHPDVVLQRGTVRIREEYQPEALGCAHVQGLSHQGEHAQLFREQPARLGLELAVIRLRHQLLPHQQDVLEEKKHKVWMEGQAPNLCRREG